MNVIEVKRQRLRDISNNLFESYIKYIILAYSKPPTVENCYSAFKELETILSKVELEIMSHDADDQINNLLLKAWNIAARIGGEAQVIVEDLIETIRKVYEN